jgi:hypothetical protein
MVVTAEQYEVIEARFPAVSPVLDVMTMNIARIRAAREAAALVPET